MGREYQSLAALAADLAFHSTGANAALLEIGEHLAAMAREKIGHQQRGWAPLAQSTEDEKARLGYPRDAPLLRTGELRDSIGFRLADEAQHVVEVGSTDPVMPYHEFGTSRMPPRPVFADLVEENKYFVIRTVVKWSTSSLGRDGCWNPGQFAWQGPERHV